MVTVIMNRVGIEEEKGIEEKSMLPSIFKDGYWFEGGELLMKEFGGGESYLSFLESISVR